ncbi:glycosyltransferase family 2 protein [Flavobacterium commune]|uniref:Glycosyltransferase n=1 Tax=Flavobacterium commune TaxID=1306519 RepID=A0A1D9P8U2_9FLAO|nr:glycosyltransferase family A protein [Flavobacterium commune]AOZ98535.1 glycosyltransferase [Flavobacterium commune]
MKSLTVFTPSYNRAYLLPQLYSSLCNQSNQDFIWLLVDDGSTDKTQELIKGWIAEDKIQIQYIYQENQGMHGAHNTAYKHITTELNTCIDSDDFMPLNAVEIILDFWNKNRSEKYAGIIGLDIDKNNKIIGSEFDCDLKSTTLSGFYERGGIGDKKIVYRTDVIKKYPNYPVFEGEKYVSLGYKYLLIDQDYELLCINKPLVVVEYQTDGSSKNMYYQYIRNPKGWSFIRKVQMQYTQSKKVQLRNCIHYVSTSLLLKNKKFIKESPLKLYTVLAIPFGILLFFFISYKTRK